MFRDRTTLKSLFLSFQTSLLLLAFSAKRSCHVTFCIRVAVSPAIASRPFCLGSVPDVRTEQFHADDETLRTQLVLATETHGAAEHLQTTFNLFHISLFV